MFFDQQSFGNGVEVISTKDEVIADIEEILHDLNVMVSWHGQTRLNSELDTRFQAKGWQTQVDSLLRIETEARSGKKNIDCRHPTQRVDVEVEFGNVASFYRDIFKLNIAKKSQQIDVGVIVTGNRRIASAVGENVASYERFRDELGITWRHIANADCPVVLYGLQPLSYPDRRDLIDPRAAQQRRSLQARRSHRKRSEEMGAIA